MVIKLPKCCLGPLATPTRLQVIKQITELDTTEVASLLAELLTILDSRPGATRVAGTSRVLRLRSYLLIRLGGDVYGELLTTR